MNVVTNMQDLTDEDLADTSRALMAELDHRRAVAALHRQVEDDIRAYKSGDRVMFNGAVWESTTDANVWAPDVYPDGWRKVEK